MDEQQAQEKRGLLSKLFQRDDWDGKRRFRWTKRPLTPEEKQQERLEEAQKKLQEEQRLVAEAGKRKTDAYNKLRIAVDFLDKQYTSPQTLRSPMPGYAQLVVLSQASIYLEEARKLDPTATVNRTINDETSEWSIDHLACNILALEVQHHMRNARAVYDEYTKQVATPASSMRDLKDRERREARQLAEHYGKARDAARKYLDYRPNDVEMMRHYAETLSHFRDHKAAKEILEKALALDPNDIETIKALDGYQ